MIETISKEVVTAIVITELDEHGKLLYRLDERTTIMLELIKKYEDRVTWLERRDWLVLSVSALFAVIVGFVGVSIGG